MDDFDMQAEHVLFPWLDEPISDIEDETYPDDIGNMPENYWEYLRENDVEDSDEERERFLSHGDESHDWANDWGPTGAVDADALASAGLGTDEDYGCYGGDDF